MFSTSFNPKEHIDINVYMPLIEFCNANNKNLCEKILEHSFIKSNFKELEEKDKEKKISLEEKMEHVKSLIQEIKEDSFSKAINYTLFEGRLCEILLIVFSIMQIKDEKLQDKCMFQLSDSLEKLSFIKYPEIENKEEENFDIELEQKIQYLVEITGMSLDYCKKSLELSNMDINVATNLLFDDPNKIEAAIEKDILRNEQISIKKKKQREERENALVEIQQTNEKKLIKNNSFFTDLFSKENQLSDSHKLLLKVFQNLDRLMVELECKLRLPEAPTEKLVDPSLVSIDLIFCVVEKYSKLLLSSDENFAINSFLVVTSLSLLNRNLKEYHFLSSDSIEDLKKAALQLKENQQITEYQKKLEELNLYYETQEKIFVKIKNLLFDLFERFPLQENNLKGKQFSKFFCLINIFFI